MTFKNLHATNNAITILSNGISDTSTILIVKSGTGSLFPNEYPYLLVLEEITDEAVTKRELVKVKYRTGDTFTIERSAGYCLADDDATTQTNTAFTFETGDRVSLRFYEEMMADMMDELNRLGAIVLVDASDSQLGHTMMSVAPASSTNPISISELDTRLPTQGENDAMAGTYGTPGSGNVFVTATDPDILDNMSLSGTQTVAGIKTFSSIPEVTSAPVNANDMVNKTYVDALN